MYWFSIDFRQNSPSTFTYSKAKKMEIVSVFIVYDIYDITIHILFVYLSKDNDKEKILH